MGLNTILFSIASMLCYCISMTSGVVMRRGYCRIVDTSETSKQPFSEQQNHRPRDSLKRKTCDATLRETSSTLTSLPTSLESSLLEPREHMCLRVEDHVSKREIIPRREEKVQILQGLGLYEKVLAMST